MDKFFPKEVLDCVLGDSYQDGEYTLGDELKHINEEIESVFYTYDEGLIGKLYVWTADNVYTLQYDLMDGRSLVSIPRNPL